MSQLHLRQMVVATAQTLREQGLTAARTGNVSVRCDGGMLITPSGVAYEAMTAQMVVFVAVSGEAQGLYAPSSEWRMHHDIYLQRPDVEAIVHAHPVYSTALACCHREIPAFHYMVASAGGDSIRCAPYETFGTQALSDACVKALVDRKACLLANHGLIATGRDLGAALQLAEEVECLAHQYCEVLKIGGGVLLTPTQMAQVMEQFKGYGQPKLGVTVS